MTILPSRNNSGRRGLVWGAAAIIVAVAFVLVLAILAAQRITQVAVQPGSPCSAASKPPVLNAPATLVTAQDYFALGDYDYDHGNCDAAIADYSRAIELNPNFSEAYNNRAYAYMSKQDYARALPDLDRAIGLRPDYVNALMNRGDIYNYYYRIDYDRAIADYDRILALGPQVYQNTSLCGHRMLAQHHGWDMTVFLDILSHGTSAGCMSATPAH